MNPPRPLASAGSALDDAEYLQRIARTLRLIERWRLADARAALRAAIACEPARPEAWNLLGVVAELGGGPLEAGRYFRAALALDPCCTAARHNLERGGDPARDLELGLQPELARLANAVREPRPSPRRTLARLAAAASAPYRSAEPPTRSRARRRWLAPLLAAAGLSALIALSLWLDGRERQALVAMPAAERVELYRRTLQDLEHCARPGAPVAFHARCVESATLILRFPECDRRCQALAHALSGATR